MRVRALRVAASTPDGTGHVARGSEGTSSIPRGSGIDQGLDYHYFRECDRITDAERRAIATGEYAEDPSSPRCAEGSL